MIAYSLEQDPALNRPLAKVMEEAASLNVRKHVIENAIASAKKSAEDAKEYLVEVELAARHPVAKR